jgi:DNA-binding HxlR family transcriptional regulator
MALGGGPLRTKELTERVPGYAPRTVYRYANKLAQIGVVERHEEPGVPSKVVHSLTEPAGRELHDLIDAYADAALGRLPSGEIGAHEWGSLALLADLWESGMIDELNIGPRSPTELSRGDHGLSFHQVSRRASLFAIGGFVEETASAPRQRRYILTEKARRAMALIAGIGRWRRQHVVPKGMTGLSAREVARLLRTVLPLVSLLEHAGKSFELEVDPHAGDETGRQSVWGEVAADGTVTGRLDPLADVDSSARGSVVAWIDSLLGIPQKELSVSGEARLLNECLRRLQEALWEEAQPVLAASGRL